jgi:hypothetical protein
VLATSEIVINEIYYHPADRDPRREFIELYNRSEQTISLGGWQFTTGVDMTLPSLDLPGDSYLIVAADETEFRRLHPQVTNVVGGWTGRLANRGENITLVDKEGTIVDQVRYADEGEWAQRRLREPDNGFRGWTWEAAHDGEGMSLELVNADLPNDFGTNWLSSREVGGSPGRANSQSTTVHAPLMTTPRHFPPIPTSDQAVVVSVDLHSEQEASVRGRLHYRIDGEAAFRSVLLEQWSAPDDPRATTATYSAIIPAQSDGTIVEFWISATDRHGLQRNYPNVVTDDATRSANLLYQVLDDYPAPSPWQPTSWQPGGVPLMHVIMTEQERRLLADIGDGPLVQAESNAQMNATVLRVDGTGTDVRYNTGVRNRGGASRVGPPNNYRINLRHDEPLEGDVAVTLNSQFIHSQILGSAIFRLAGLPVAEAAPVEVRVNGANLAEAEGPRMFGRYAQVEVITGSFPDRHFPDDSRGNLYRGFAAGVKSADLGYLGPEPSEYEATYSKETNEELDDWSDLIQLTRILTEVSDDEFIRRVDQVLNVDQWLRFFALDSLLGNRETGLSTGSGDNYWLYRGTVDTRFQIIPHDLDTLLGRARLGQPNRSIFSYTALPGLTRLLTHPEIVPRYYQAFLDLMRDVYNPAVLNPLMDQVLGDFVPAAELDSMKQFVVDRMEGVLSQLPREFTITHELPEIDGWAHSSRPQVSLTGTADAVRAKSVRVQGELANWSPWTREWQLATQGTGESQMLVDFGAAWRYLDDGTDQQSAWRLSDYDDSLWATGAAPLGYGNGDETTVVRFGPNPNDKYVTTYFRHEFEVADPEAVLDLVLRLQRDDGAIVYLNEQEIVRSNMPAGAIDFQTVASSWIGGGLEQQTLNFSIDPTLLRRGENLITVEVHQRSPIDDDLRLDLSLEATVGTITGGVPLVPGVNRVRVQSFSNADGTGDVIDDGYVDVWYDGAAGIDRSFCEVLRQQELLAPSVLTNNTLTRNTIMAPCGPAYQISGQLEVPDGVTLTILPGTTLFFADGAELQVDGGRLIAEGTSDRTIRFTRLPGSNANWNGIQLDDTMQDNRLSYAVLEYASTEDGMVGLDGSRLQVDHSTFDHADRFRIRSVNSSLRLTNSTFTDIFAPNQPPTSDNASEHLWGSGIAEGGELRIEGNYFGTTKGHNDAIDFDGARRPSAIPYIIDNYFAGSGDDGLDLETDAHIEGNTFANIRKDQYNTATGDANSISAGGEYHFVVVRNIFAHVDHAVQVKDGAFLTFENNTVFDSRLAAIYFDLPDRTPGRGALITDSIFSQVPNTFSAADQAQELAVHRSLVEDNAIGMGDGNLHADPRFVDAPAGNFRLAPGSAALGSALNGGDRGAWVEPGATLSVAPEAIVTRRDARFTVGGAGITEYRYRVNGEAWSESRPRDANIELTNLADGTYQVEVIGRNSAGIWQSDTQATQSTRWTVQGGRRAVRLNEILADNRSSYAHQGAYPDVIELYNASTTPYDVSGYQLTDDPARPNRYTFPAGTMIAPHSYLLVYADQRTDLPGLHAPFALSRQGEQIQLRDTQGRLIDEVAFGLQAADWSLGRVGVDAAWQLTRPTLGAANERAMTGNVFHVRINEWLAASSVQLNDDFVELYNADELPVAIGGLSLTDHPRLDPHRHVIAPLSFIGGKDFAVFQADGNIERGADHLSFGLASSGEVLALLTADARMIDQVLFFAEATDIAHGRTPDGGANFAHQRLATPGLPNVVESRQETVISEWSDTWAYDATGTDWGNAWRDASFDDSLWTRGAGPLAAGIQASPIPVSTTIPLGATTFYFRRAILISDEQLNPSSGWRFELETLIDDGAVIYVNGHEVLRVGMPDGQILPTTRANRGVGAPEVEGRFAIPGEFLRPGSNVIAVEVHQVSAGSADVAFGSRLQATRTVKQPSIEVAESLLMQLRIAEVMYHPTENALAEFIELVNIGDTTLQLAGVRLTGGVEFTFPARELAAGERIVVAADEAAIRQQFGNDIPVAGTFDGRLSNSSDQIQLMLPEPWTGVIQHLAYSDRWYPSTDGDGRSLVIRDPAASVESLAHRFAWRASADAGSPGTAGTAPLLGDVDNNQHVDVLDLAALSAAIRDHRHHPDFDLTGDGVVLRDDVDYLMIQILGTLPGDANLDGRFDSADLVQVFAAGQYEDSITGNSTWATGDWNGDGEFNSSDLVTAFQWGGYEGLSARVILPAIKLAHTSIHPSAAWLGSGTESAVRGPRRYPPS